MIRAAFALLLALTGHAAADGGRAAEMLERAEAMLSAARSNEERLAALGRAAQAREAGLAALREGLRAGAARRAEIEAAFRAEERRLLAVLAALQRLERAPRAAAAAHPGGPVAAARAEMSLAAFTPALAAATAALAADLREIDALAREQDTAAAAARGALAALQQMRGALAELTRDSGAAAPLGSDLAARMQAETEALARQANTLRALAGALPATGSEGRPRAASFAAARALSPPAEGRLSRRFGAAGTRPSEGVEIATEPWAAVYAPWRSVVRFAGPFGAEGVVVILEPDPDVLIVFSGLGSASVSAGATIPAGAPVGTMGGPPPAAEEFLIAATTVVETLPRETLYMEVRRGGAPADPAIWFAFGKEEGDRP